MKTETHSQAPRAEAARQHAPSSIHRSQAQDKAPPADLFAQLLASQDDANSPIPASSASSAVLDTLDEAAPATGAELTLQDDSKALDDDDPRVSFLALFQPQGLTDEPSVMSGEKSASEGSTLAPSLKPHDQATDLRWTEPATERPKTKGHTAPVISETTLRQRLGMEAPPALATNDATMQFATKAWHMAQPGQPGSALLNETSPTGADWGQAVASAAGGLGHGGQHASGNGSDGAPGGQAQPGRVWLDQPSPSSGIDAANPGESESFAMSLGEAMGDAYETLGTQVSLWSAANTKRASMTVELGQDRALEVDVSLNDGKAQLAFRTDDQQVRENLRTQAEGILADLLARSGIALESLSVGAQHTGQGQQQNPSGQPSTRVQVQLTPEFAQQPDGNIVQRSGQGRAGLDIYA